jgi:hypothetical protein
VGRRGLEPRTYGLKVRARRVRLVPRRARSDGPYGELGAPVHSVRCCPSSEPESVSEPVSTSLIDWSVAVATLQEPPYVGAAVMPRGRRDP